MAPFSMPWFRLVQNLHILLFLLFYSVRFSHADAVILKSSLSERQADNHGILPWSFIAEEDSILHPTNSLSMDNTSFKLALDRTKRKDPTKLYTYYTGGWNISDEHYWASAASSAIPLFAFALAWFIGFGVALLFICCCSCCCRQRRYSYSRHFFALSLLLLIVFTCTAIIGGIVLYNIQGKFHNSTINMLDYVKVQSNFIVNNLQNFSRNMGGAKSINVNQVFLSADLQTKIGDTVKLATISADELSSRSSTNLRNIDDFLKSVRIDLVIGSAVMLLLVFLGFLFSILGMQFLVYCLVLIGWIVIAGAFILCGVVLLLHNVVGDTCVAMDEWILKPQEATALDDILPCINAATAKESLMRSKEVTFELVKVVNDVITNVPNENFRSPVVPSRSNSNLTGPLMPTLCNPFESDLRDRKCKFGEVSFEDAPQVWKTYLCKTNVISGKEVCITPSIYSQLIVATTMSQSLYLFSPFLIMVANCSFGKETFSLIETDYCPGFVRYSKGMYRCLTLFSAAMILCLIFWMVHVRERRRLQYAKQFIVMEGQPGLVEENKL
ncbi:uncharacterized protein LOC110025364 isoform X2 [Phalaenopsis equestris]|uniref:uncharacterized protein LOC110025364 isoform X2 n=1 Tax=Phalaenopsis equestris TaxID=78828 RepID=UPI0009E507C7|nr:uncharacterized protein LOC110025364 isoform X2 [Phalaenopsis equestris]